MSETKQGHTPADPLVPGLRIDDCVTDLWDGVPGEISDASRSNRANAITYYSSEAGIEFNEVRCTIAYVHLFDRQDGWDCRGRDRWYDDWYEKNEIETVWHEDRKGQPDEWTHHAPDGTLIEDNEPPDEPPEDWEPHEDDPAWEFCKKETPGAIKVWHCEQKELK